MHGNNDFLVLGFAPVASLASRAMKRCTGSDPVQGWISVNIAMAPFLILAASSLIWLMRQPKGVRLA